MIERVQRLADFEHDVIGHVHDVVDAAKANFFQSAFQPVGTRTHFHFADDARRVTRTQFRLVILHAHQTADRFGFRVEKLDGGNFQFVARDRRDFARDADDAVQVRPIRCDFQIIDHVAAAAAEKFRERLADFRIGRQN